MNTAGKIAESAACVLMLSLTNACNLRCRHCYRADPKIFAQELAAAEIVRILREFTDLVAELGKTGVVVFSGGEPLLYEQLGLMARVARSLGLTVRVNTNATLATPEVANALNAWGVECAQVSLDGANKAEHEAIRGRGSWEPTVRGVASLQAAGLAVVLKVTLIHDANDADPGAFVRLAASWGVLQVSFARVLPIGTGAGFSGFGPGAYRQVLAAIARARSATVRTEIRDATFDQSFLGGMPYRYQSEEGRAILAIDADGAGYVSRRLPLLLGNIRESALADLWRHPTMELLRTGGLQGKCRSCALLTVCGGGSRAAAWAASQQLLAPDPDCWVGAVA
ncbi:MAG: radical SAM protein [Cyanobacteria bacterium NC_groundwater_1444_Ag_S-0.65um_54_12]|nr:radical SAM protein [Cyanobacteria bacterium NC_groundwater_1444_Ag_S-0.65um_54_12]